MIRNRYIKTFIACFLVLVTIWVATPGFYIHELLDHNHSQHHGTGTSVNPASAEDCDFDQYNKPVYFNLFKFISGFIPNHKPQSLTRIHSQQSLSALSIAISLLRAPPALH
jgi:hypothetical protein